MQSNILVVLSFTSETNFWLVNELQKKGNQVYVLVNKYAQSEDFFSKRFKMSFENVWHFFLWVG